LIWALALENRQNKIIVLAIDHMAKGTEKGLWQEIFSNLLKGIYKAISYLSLKIWRLIKYRFFKIKDRRIIYGKLGNQEIFDHPINRNQQTYIMGKPGFGKSAEAANMALQNVKNGTPGIFIDPHGNPEEIDDSRKGAIVHIYERAEDISNIVYLSVNQKYKVIGFNPLFLIASIDALDDLKDELLNSMFGDSLDGGYQVANRAKFILESAIYFHNAYADWLMQVLGKTNQQTKTILQTHQLTINDLANLNGNPLLMDLLIQILGYTKSKFARPDLVRHWQEVKDKGSLDAGMVGAIGRLEKIVSTTKAQLFFEAHGFNFIEERRKGKFVLIDTSRLDKFTRAIISKLVFGKILPLHINGIIREQTELYIDEAGDLDFANLDEMLSQGRKFGLSVTAIFQHFKQFATPRIIEAIRKVVVIKIIFRSEEGEYNAPLEKVSNLKKREFIFINSRGVKEFVKTLDMPPKQRTTMALIERGVGRDQLRERIMAKRSNIVGYFNNV